MSQPRIPQLPGGPDPSQPVPRTPVDGIDLRTYAALSARIAAGAEPRGAVLARAGLDEMRWMAVEQTWMLRIATALLQHDLSLGQEHEEAFAAARAEIRAQGGTR